MDRKSLKRKSEVEPYEQRIKSPKINGSSGAAFGSLDGDSKMPHYFPIHPATTQSYESDYFGTAMSAQNSQKSSFHPQSYIYTDYTSDSPRSTSTSPVSPPLSPSQSPIRQETPPDTPPPSTASSSSSYVYYPHQVPSEPEFYSHSSPSQYSYVQSDRSRSNYSMQYYPLPQQYSHQLQQSSSPSNFSSQSSSFAASSASYPQGSRNYSIDMHSMSKLKVPQLKSLLGQYHLKKSGKKQELIDRLASYLQSTGTPFSPSSVIKNWPRKINREIKPHMDISGDEMNINRKPWTEGGGQKLLPSSFDGGLQFTMPPPLHVDMKENYPTFVWRFGASLVPPILVDESCHKIEVPNAIMSKHFQVYYQRNPVDSKQCLHHLYFVPRTSLSLTLVQHRELFAYHREGYELDPLCPHCSGYAETWMWDLRRKSGKQEHNPLLKWLSQHFTLEHHVQSMFGDKSWSGAQCWVRICSSGHLSISLTESSNGQQGHSRRFVGAFSPRRSDLPSAHSDLEMDVGMNLLGLSAIDQLVITPIQTRCEEVGSLGRVDEPGDVALWL